MTMSFFKALTVAAAAGRKSLHLSTRFRSGIRTFPVLNPSDPATDDPRKFEAAVANSEDAEEKYLRLKAICERGGGERGVERHVKKNKKILVRDRIEGIVDADQDVLELSVTAGTAMEYGDVPGAGTVSVIANVSGVKCLILANDATVKGGTSYPITVTKSLRAQEIAAENRLPCIYIVDSGGAFLPLQSEIFPDAKHGGRSFANQAVMSSLGVPQMSLVAGLCTAGGAYTPTMADEHIMVHKIANVYLGGPPLVKAALGEVVSGETLGGATVHCAGSGVADHFAGTEEESFEILRDAVASLNVPPEEDSTQKNGEEPLFDEEGLEFYGGLEEPLTRGQMEGLLARILDGSRFREFKRMFGGRLMCGFGRLHGRQVGIVANVEGGQVSWKEGQKGAHFVQLCDSRDVPIVFLQNSGQVPNREAIPDAASLKERGKMARCVANVRVPKISINVTGCHGDDHFYLCGPGFKPRFYFCWPRSSLKKSLEDEIREDDEEGFPSHSAFYAASRLTCDGIVLPKNTRKVLRDVVEISMLNHIRTRTIVDVKLAAGIPLSHPYGPMRI